MSLNRLILYGAIIGGWSAFVGWLLCEMLIIRLFGLEPNRFPILVTVLMAAFVGAGIGGGLMMLAGVASGQWSGAPRRFRVGLLGGLIAGLVGGLIAGTLYAALGGILSRIVGWAILGLTIGAVDGIYERSPRRLRNGLIGGGIGGFLGGLLFEPIAYLLHSSSGMSGRCFGFVLLGLCIGLLISLVQVVLKTAWLTVVEGFRPGRQLILTESQTTLGTSEKVALPFIAFGAKGVEPVHLIIYRQPDASFVVQDNNTRTGTRLNGQPLAGPALLKDGDVLHFGVNRVRFSERRRTAGEAAVVAQPLQPATTVRTAQAIRAALPPQPVSAKPVPAAMPPRPATPPSAIPVQPYPPPPRPVSPPSSVTQPPSRPARSPQSAPQTPGTASGASVMGNCPNCGSRTAGIPGKRVCRVCQQVF